MLETRKCLQKLKKNMFVLSFMVKTESSTALPFNESSTLEFCWRSHLETGFSRSRSSDIFQYSSISYLLKRIEDICWIDTPVDLHGRDKVLGPDSICCSDLWRIWHRTRFCRYWGHYGVQYTSWGWTALPPWDSGTKATSYLLNYENCQHCQRGGPTRTSAKAHNCLSSIILLCKVLPDPSTFQNLQNFAVGTVTLIACTTTT